MSEDILDKIKAAKPGQLFKRSEVDRQLNILRKKTSKWKTLTDEYQFQEGDVYILPNFQKEINTFRAYIKHEFNLSVAMFPVKEDPEKVAAQIIKFTTKKKRKK